MVLTTAKTLSSPQLLLAAGQVAWRPFEPLNLFEVPMLPGKYTLYNVNILGYCGQR